MNYEMLDKMKIWGTIILFLAGLYFIFNYNTRSVIENFETSSNCPNVLLEKDGKFLLYNSSKMEVPGVNPVQFNNLEEYTEFVSWLRGNGIKCPVLFAKQTYTTQGDKSYKICPSGDPDICGLPQTQLPTVSKLIDAGHNKGSMPGFDPNNQYVGDYTPLDKMYNEGEKQKLSANPMDNNWGGVKYAQESVYKGDYSGDQVSVYVDNKPLNREK